MTTVYFVRHAQPNFKNHNDLERELTEKGLKDRELVTNYLEDKHIDVVLSSPYKRAVDTVQHFADQHDLPVALVEGFKERKVDSVWVDDFDSFCKQQWSDFSYKLSDGETLGEVQERNITALKKVLNDFRDKSIVIGSHGTALSTVIHYYNTAYGYSDFANMRNRMPWIVKFTFDVDALQAIETIDLFGNNAVLKEEGAF